MLYAGLHLFNDSKQHSFYICHVSHCGKWFAIANMNEAFNAIHPPKPEKVHREALLNRVSKLKLSKQRYSFPPEMTFSDVSLKELQRAKWIHKRDEKYRRIAPLCSEVMLNKYLYGDGVSKEIDRMIPLTESWNSRGAFYNALNRFITFGCNENALLPFNLKNVGSNYRHFEKPSEVVIKRGRGKADNSLSRSKSRGITNQDKKNILKTVRRIKGKFSLKMAHEKYQDEFERSELQRKVGCDTSVYFHPHPKEECISYQQFQYHLKQLVSPELLIKKAVGQLRFDKDFKAKQGSSLDGVLGATDRYEIDATVLDLYVRYPYDKSGRFTMGRPVLYIVIDVYSTMITGFYLGFDGPNWSGAAQALVNACTDKVEFAAKFGVNLEENDWPAKHIPRQITVDNGNEYPNALIASVLKAELGVEAFNFTAIYRGDAKGTVEGTFNVLNNTMVHHQPGSIFKDIDRGEQHPSNQSLYSYEEVVGKLIHEIIYHNNSAERLSKFNWQAVFDDIDVSPQALFQHSLEKDMDGGRPTTSEDIASVNWGFLPEEKATVQKDGVRFRGIMYSSEEAGNLGFFSKAAHSGRYSITVKRAHQNCSHIWHKTPSGQYIRFDIKNVNNGSPFLDAQWEIADHLYEYYKQKRFDAGEVKRHQRAKRDGANAQIERSAREATNGIPPSNRKSMQPNISGRQEHQKEINQQREAEQFQQSLDAMEQDLGRLDDEGLIDLDEEFYG